jgi:hypothetical protein
MINLEQLRSNRLRYDIIFKLIRSKKPRSKTQDRPIIVFKFWRNLELNLGWRLNTNLEEESILPYDRKWRKKRCLNLRKDQD